MTKVTKVENMTNTENNFKELVEMTEEFSKSSIDELYHSPEKEEEARELREWYKNHPLKFEDLNLTQRRELGFGTWSKEAGEYELIPLWVFRLLDPEQILICRFSSPKVEIARAQDCDDDTRAGVVAYQFHRNPTEEELKKLEEDEEVEAEEAITTLGDLMRAAIESGSIVQEATYTRSETRLIPPEEEPESVELIDLAEGEGVELPLNWVSEAQSIADLTWNARRGAPKVNVEAVIELTRNLAKYGFSEVTITLPGGLYESEACRFAEELLDELEKRGFKASWYDHLNGEDNDIHIDWSHLLKADL